MVEIKKDLKTRMVNMKIHCAYEVEGKVVGSRGKLCLGSLGARVLMLVQERRKGHAWARRSRKLLGDVFRKPGTLN